MAEAIMLAALIKADSQMRYILNSSQNE